MTTEDIIQFVKRARLELAVLVGGPILAVGEATGNDVLTGIALAMATVLLFIELVQRLRQEWRRTIEED